ncbi:MAG: ribonuclease III [Proteobacteria bacterium]|nr:ribonuclease III [Pseudomonadota bacterium]
MPGGIVLLPSLEALQTRMGYQFQQPQLLEEALTHPSASGATNGDFNRLEFLGDRVLGAVIGEELLARHPTADAGQLALKFNALVRREACAAVARNLEIGPEIRLAAAERAEGGGDKSAILADACEALIAAVHLDGGNAASGAFVRRHWHNLLLDAGSTAKDAKTSLQEWTHQKLLPPPLYQIISTEGPPHRPVFTISVEVPGGGAAFGRGTTKREAEQQAAAALLKDAGAL